MLQLEEERHTAPKVFPDIAAVKGKVTSFTQVDTSQKWGAYQYVQNCR